MGTSSSTTTTKSSTNAVSVSGDTDYDTTESFDNENPSSCMVDVKIVEFVKNDDIDGAIEYMREQIKLRNTDLIEQLGYDNIGDALIDAEEDNDNYRNLCTQYYYKAYSVYNNSKCYPKTTTVDGYSGGYSRGKRRGGYDGYASLGLTDAQAKAVKARLKTEGYNAALNTIAETNSDSSSSSSSSSSSLSSGNSQNSGTTLSATATATKTATVADLIKAEEQSTTETTSAKQSKPAYRDKTSGYGVGVLDRAMRRIENNKEKQRRQREAVRVKVSEAREKFSRIQEKALYARENFVAKFCEKFKIDREKFEKNKERFITMPSENTRACYSVLSIILIIVMFSAIYYMFDQYLLKKERGQNPNDSSTFFDRLKSAICNKSDKPTTTTTTTAAASV